MIEGGWPPNPYNYGMPARDAVFAARDTERKLFERFAASITAERTAHLLIHGRRGVGKTSLLGQLRTELERHDLIVGLLTLDDDSATEADFLAETIGHIAEAVISAGGFGGIGGDYDLAIERVTVGDSVETDIGPLRVIEFCARRHGRRVPDQFVSRDLSELVDAAREIDKVGIVLIFDEADRLVDQPATLQRLRNLFVQSGLLSIVLCGTDRLVAGLDTALAPMGRHFQKILVRPLTDSSETQSLLDKPLRVAGLAGHDMLPSGLATEIHKLTLGSPYESTLLAHAMYDDMIDRDGSSMELNERVLEQVAEQLRPSAEDQAALAILRVLPAADVSIAARYCIDPHLTMHEHSLLRIAFDDPSADRAAAARSQIAEEWQKLETLRLAHQDAEFLRPDFGELSRLYLKYKAHVLGVLPPLAEGTYSERLAELIRDKLVAAVPNARLARVAWRSNVDIVDGSATGLSSEFAFLRDRNFAMLAEKYTLLSFLALELAGGATILESDDDDTEQHRAIEQTTFILAPYEIGEDGFVWLGAFQGIDPDVAPEAMVEALSGAFAAASPYRIKGGRLEYAVLSTDDVRELRKLINWQLAQAVTTSVWYDGSRDTAVQLLRRYWRRLGPELDADSRLPTMGLNLLNSFGFMELASGYLPEAQLFFERAAARGGLAPGVPPELRAMLLCNLAAVSAGLGNPIPAIDWARQARAIAATNVFTESPGVLSPYVPDPDWPKQPLLVSRPDVAAVALATEASATAVSGDANFAEELASELLQVTDEKWARDVVTAIAKRIERPELART